MADMGWGQPADAASYWKAGAPDVQSVSQFARLPAPGVHRSPAQLAVKDFRRLGLEIEVAFRLRRDVSAVQLAAMDAVAAVAVGQADRATAVAQLATLFDAMTVSIELVDFRWQGGEHAPALLRLADMQCHGALVLGDWVPLRVIDWPMQTASLEIGGAVVGRYQGSLPCVDPWWTVPEWLSHAVTRHGHLAAGSVVTTGSWCGVVWRSATEQPVQIRASFDGIGAASLTLV